MSLDEPIEVRPWDESQGPAPRATVYPRGGEPALWVRAGGGWRYAVVRQRSDWADGRVVYHVAVSLDGVSTVRRAYWWGQPGVRIAHGPGDRRYSAGKLRTVDAA